MIPRNPGMRPRNDRRRPRNVAQGSRNETKEHHFPTGIPTWVGCVWLGVWIGLAWHLGMVSGSMVCLVDDTALEI